MPRMTHTAEEPPQAGIYAVADVRRIDRAAIDGGIDGYELMCRAGRFALDTGLAEFGDGGRWLVLCGAGNNAGDGYVVARLARERGIDARVRYLSLPDRLDGDAARAFSDARTAGVPIEAFDGALDAGADLLVDALLGSGLDRPVAGRYAQAVEAANAHAAPVLALDIPTGLHGDSGATLGTAIDAAATATFVGRKSGLYLGDGPDRCGRLCYSSLDVPDSAFSACRPLMRLIPADLAARALPPRRLTSHKGDFGHVLLLGGGPGMPGAARLAGEAALRAGAGRVTAAVHPANAAAIPATRPELMCHAVGDVAAVEALLPSATVLALGPGLGRSDWSREVFAAARAADLPMVIDADGLNLLAAAPDRRERRILTPHPGEAGRLLQRSAAEVQRDRLGALADLEECYGGCIVLKGHMTLVSRPGRAPWLCTAGNPGMATAGMGDVLTGIVAGLLAQGLDTPTAAAVAVDVHARAADVAAAGGQRGLLASDLLAELRPRMNPGG